MSATLLIVGGLAAAIYVGLCVWLYLNQEDFIFFRVSNDPQLVEQWQSQRVSIPSVDANTPIEGWWSDNPDAGNDAIVLYFGGNAEDVLYAATTAKNLQARRFLVTNYRDYGKTPGKPSEAALCQDALAIYDYVIKQPNVTAEKIVVVGRSLGSGVAAYLAAHRAVGGVVLVTPFDSLALVAQSHYPMFPIRLLLKHRFPSIELATQIDAPVLIIAAGRDNVVPPVHAKRLFDALPGAKHWQLLPDAGHNDIDQYDSYYKYINEFLHSLPRTR